MNFLNLFKSKPEPEQAPAQIPQMGLRPSVIHINISNQNSILRNKGRISRLQRAIEKGKGTPEIEAELAARIKATKELVAAIGDV